MLFLSALAALSLFSWVWFLVIFQSYSPLERFLFLRDKFSSYASSALYAEPSFMEFTDTGNALILAMPSVIENGSIDPSQQDRAVLVHSRGMAIASVYPSPSSSRRHETYFIRGVDSMTIDSGGSVASVAATMSGRKFSGVFFINPVYTLLPQDAGAK